MFPINTREILQNRFFRSSSIVFIGSTAANFINYAFNILMGRMLDPAEYGEMAALITLAMITSVPSGTLSNLTAKYISEHDSFGEKDLIAHTYQRGNKLSLTIGLVFLASFWLLAPFIGGFLKIEKLPVFIFGLLLPLGMVLGNNKGALQGLQSFRSLSNSTVLEAAGKLLASAALVFLGFSVSGAVGGLLIGTILGIGYSFTKLKRLVLGHDGGFNRSEYNIKRVPGYTKLVFWTNLFLAVFGNIDVVLAKHYLDWFDAGSYAALAVLGRIITFAAIAVITVLLPMAASSHAKGDGKSQRYLWLAVVITSIISGMVLFIFFAAPGWTITNLFGANYVSIASYLGIFGVVMLFGSLSKIFINYFIAIHEKKFIYPFAILTVGQIFLIYLLHESIWQIVMVLLATNVILLVSMYFIYKFMPKPSQLNN